MARDLPHQRYFYGAYVRGALCGLRTFILVLRQELICSDADAFDFNIWQESVPDNFCDVDGSADGSSACFYSDFFCAAVEEGDACEDIVHYGFFAD